MSELYLLDTPGEGFPVTIGQAKAHLRLETDADDAVISQLVCAATEIAEDHTRRDFRANTWKLLLDEFTDPICLRRHPVASITSITHLVADVATVVPAADYYLKKRTQDALILLVTGAVWPSNTDLREQAIEVTFMTEVHPRIEMAKAGILRIVAHAYENRGDDLDVSHRRGEGPLEIVHASGAWEFLDKIRIVRV